MKKLLTILFLSFSCNLFAIDIYLSGEGDNANSGLTPLLPKATLSGIAAFLTAGNTIHIERGFTYSGTMVILGAGVTIDAYGTGSNPIISGFSTVASWTNVGGNIWESNVLGAKAIVDIVIVDGEQKAPARYPNTGYFTYQSSTSTSYTASGLTGMPSFTGGECVARKERWIMDRQAITSNSGTTLNVATSVSGYGGKNGAGLFVQKHLNCLDAQG